jgi:DNA-binding NtrC family response regulator
MAKLSPKTAKLSRILDGSQNIVAAVDENNFVTYANDACCQWLGVAKTDLVGKRCVYSSQREVVSKNPAAGLCPPPESLHGRAVAGAIFRWSGDQRDFCPADFIPLTIEADRSGYVLIFSVGSQTEPSAVEYNCLPEKNRSTHLLLADMQMRHEADFAVDQLVGASPQSQLVRRQVNAAAESGADVLIVGASGTGRQQIARTIFNHRVAAAGDGISRNLIPVHCDVADGQTIQDCVRNGAFHQRTHKNEDWLLLLDVDQLSVEGQSELYGFYTLPGVQIRTLSTATSEISNVESRFHAELAMRLSTMTIRMKELRERPEDIPVLAQLFIEMKNRDRQQQLSGCTNEVLELLCEYHWPNNIDELRRVIESAVETATGPRIQIADLPAHLMHGLTACRVRQKPDSSIQLDEYLKSIETELVRRALRQSRNNKSRAAELLGINRARLLRRMAQLGLLDKSPAGDQADSDLVDPSAFEEVD